MFTSRDLKAIITEARPIVERQLDDALVIASFREKVTAQGGDWSQVKALVKAMIQDERDDAGGHKRVLAIMHKAGNALGYADMLGLGNLNEKNSFPDHDPITGEIADETPMSHASGQPGGDDPETPDDAASAGETATNTRRMSMTPLEPREAGGLKGFGFTVRFDEPDAALRPQTAGTETAVANSTPGSGAGTVDAGEANWPSEMTTASPANEPETIPPVADPATVVSEAANGDSAPSLAAIPVADQSKPNPICRDPDDCGVYASWAMPCQACKAAAAHRSAA